MEMKIVNKTETLNQLRFEYGFENMEWCSDEENQKYLGMGKNNQELPENVFQDDFSKGCFYKIVDCGFSYEERMEYLKYKEFELIEEQTRKINTVRKIAIFYLVCSIIVAISSLLAMLGK